MVGPMIKLSQALIAKNFIKVSYKFKNSLIKEHELGCQEKELFREWT